jgi:hypothetical protein
MKEIGRLAVTLAMAFGVVILGEIAIPLTGLDRFIARHESALMATAIGTTAAGFALFMR